MVKRLHRVDERLFRAETLGKAHKAEKAGTGQWKKRHRDADDGSIYRIRKFFTGVPMSIEEAKSFVSARTVWRLHCYR